MKKLGILLLGLALFTVSCNNKTSRTDLPIEGSWDGSVYTNERAKFTVDVPESVQMSEVMDLNEAYPDLRRRLYCWELRTPQGRGNLLYMETVVEEEFFSFSKLLRSLEKDSTVVNLEYQPWYKMLRTKIVADKIEADEHYREIHYVCHNVRYVIVYPTDEQFSNPAIEQFVENLSIDISYVGVLGEVSEGVWTLLGFAILIIAGLLYFGWEFLPKVLRPVLVIMAMLLVAGLIWLITGVPCPTTWWMMGFCESFFLFELWFVKS